MTTDQITFYRFYAVATTLLRRVDRQALKTTLQELAAEYRQKALAITESEEYIRRLVPELAKRATDAHLATGTTLDYRMLVDRQPWYSLNALGDHKLISVIETGELSISMTDAITMTAIAHEMGCWIDWRGNEYQHVRS